MKQYDKYKYALPPVITAALLLIIYMVKHIYPFGNITIDYYDMAQQISSFYYHVYDFLHGEKALFYDPYTALGVNMAMSTSGCSHLSIFNLFFLFVKREMLLESLSFFLLIKMMIMSFFMYLYVHKKFKVEYVYEVAFSVMYAFSGYVLMLYMTIQWLDIAALFPLLMYFLHLLIKDGKYGGYITVLTMSIVACYYLSFMILIYIVLMVGTVIFTDSLFEKKGYDRLYENYHLVKLFFATVISMGLSMFILLPQMAQTLLSARFNNESSGGLLSMYYGIVSTTKPAYTTRWWTLLVSSFSFAIIVYGLIRFRRDIKSVFSVILVMILMLSELIVEGVNLFWHFGSYVQYPIRNGFMINFTLSVLALGFIEKITKEEPVEIRVNGKKLFQLAAIIVLASAIATLVFLKYYSSHPGLMVRNVFHMTSAVMLITFIIYLAFMYIKGGRYFKSSLGVILTECILFGFILIGKPTFITGYTEDTEQEGEYIRICDQLNEAFSLDLIHNSGEDGQSLVFSRVKNPDTSLNANYGLVLRRPVLSNWTHLLSPRLQRDSAKLGYSVQYTRLLDAGGTVFSDALLGIDMIISCIPQDENLYTLIDSEDIVIDHISGEKRKYYLYECKYQLPYGIVTDSIDYGFDEDEDACDVYNKIYRSIAQTEDDIAEEILGEKNTESGSNLVTGSDKEDRLRVSTTVDGRKALYYFADQVDTDDYNTSIKVNGEEVLVPSIGETENTLYPAHFNNNALYLGSFENEDVTFDIEFSHVDKNGNEIEAEFAPKVISINLDALEAICGDNSEMISDRRASKKGYSFEVKAMDEVDEASDEAGERYLLLPISYDEGYKAKVNGKSSDVLSAGGIFLAVAIGDGQSSVDITFSPKGITLGTIASAISALLLLVFIYVNKKSELLDREYKWLSSLYIMGYLIALIAIYLVPYCFCLMDLFGIINT